MKKTLSYTIDFLFPISIFFAFFASAVIVLLLSSNIYKDIVGNSQRNFETGTTLSYITEKIRQNDDCSTGDIYLCQFDDYDALAISQTYNDETYVTYIYEANGKLKESFLKEGVTPLAESGTTVLETGKLKMYQLTEDLLRFTCTSKDGYTTSVTVHIHSKSH